MEEPGEDCLFLLITSKYDTILPTIRSRCSVINFSPLSDNEIKEVAGFYNRNISDEIINLSAGSIERAFLIDDLKLFNVLEDIKNKDFKKFTWYILNIDDILIFKAVIEFLYPYALQAYKSSGESIYIRYGEYILEILKSLNYNVNMDLAKHDFVSKTIEVFGERV